MKTPHDSLRWKPATLDDAELLAALNLQLIQDEGHRNPMPFPALLERMRQWLAGEYRAVIFELGPEAIAYALYGEHEDHIHLRQFFVGRDSRRRGIGRTAMRMLLREILPPEKRIRVAALTGNEAAVRFWRAVGFRDYSLTFEMPSASDASAAP